MTTPEHPPDDTDVLADDPTAVLFVRLYTKVLDNDQMLALSFAAFGLWSLVLLLCKRAGTDGVISYRQLRREALSRSHTKDDLEALIDELEEAGALRVGDSDTWNIEGWTKYNRPILRIGADRRNRRKAGLKANHQRHHVNKDRPNPDCMFCVAEGLAKSENPLVTPISSDSDSDRSPIGVRSESDRSPIETESETESESYLKDRARLAKQGPPQADKKSQANGSNPADRCARTILDDLGYTKPDQLTSTRLFGAVTTAIARGHRPEVIHKLATDDATVSHSENPGQVAVKVVLALAAKKPEADPMANIDEGPPVIAADEGWDDPDTVKAGLAAARAAARPQPPDGDEAA